MRLTRGVISQQDRKTWAANHALVVGFLRGACGMDRFSSDEIHRAIGIIATNGVRLETTTGTSPSSSEARPAGPGIGYVYHREMFKCSHMSSTMVFIDGMQLVPEVFPPQPQLRLQHSDRKEAETGTQNRAGGDQGHKVSMTIRESQFQNLYTLYSSGEDITTRYTTPQWGTFRRQQLLQNQWHFVCRCRRCEDPTEAGTMMNAIRCQKENNGDRCRGMALPKEPTR